VVPEKIESEGGTDRALKRGGTGWLCAGQKFLGRAPPLFGF